MEKVLGISDLHGDFSLLPGILDIVHPDLLICCGDWGDPGEVSEEDFAKITSRVHTLSVHGNHDDLELLARLRNRDGSPVLLGGGEVVTAAGMRIAGISGIWARSHAKPWYVTDEDVLEIATKAAAGGVDILVTHGCATGLNDLLHGGRHGGQRCFLQAFEKCEPWVYLCGHLHNQQMKRVMSDRYVLNVGQTAGGDFAVVEHSNGTWKASVEKLKLREESY